MEIRDPVPVPDQVRGPVVSVMALAGHRTSLLVSVSQLQ